MSKRIYLDHNATTPIDPRVLEEMQRLVVDVPANPGSRHADGRKARQALEGARDRIAEILDCRPNEVIFTSGGTESNNLALLGMAHGIRKGAMPEGGLLATTGGEHPAVAEPVKILRKRGWSACEIPLTLEGEIDERRLSDLPWSEISIVNTILAHNETGVIQRTEALRAICEQHKICWHMDGVQAVGKIPVGFQDLGVTSLSFAAHKFHGPRGIGGLVLREGTPISPRQHGGFQERGIRPGTEVVWLAGGMARALELWHERRAEFTESVTRLRNLFEQRIRESIPTAVVIGEGAARRLPNTSLISFPGIDADSLLMSLDLEGISCSLGSACASGSTEPSPVLVAMGLPPDVFRSAVRFSLGRGHTEDEMKEAGMKVISVVDRLR